MSITLTNCQSLSFRFTAILVLAVAAIGPFTQQILHLSSVPLLEPGNATLPIGTTLFTSHDNFTVWDSGDFPGFFAPGIGNAFSAGLYATSPSDFAVNPQCPSGNCTWTNYTTFVVKNQIVDITHRLKFANRSSVKSWLESSNFPNILNLLDDSPISSNGLSIVSLPASSNSASSQITFDQTWSSLGIGFSIEGDAGPASFNQSHNLTWNVFLTSVQPVGVEANYSLYKPGSIPFHVYYLDMALNATHTSAGWGEISLVYNTAMAWECLFDFGLQSYNAKQQNGIFNEAPFGELVSYNGPGCNESAQSYNPSCALTFSLHDTQYTISLEGARGLQNTLEQQLLGWVFGGEIRWKGKNGTTIFGGVLSGSSDSSAYIHQVIVNQADITTASVTAQFDPDRISNSSAVFNITLDGVMGNIAHSLTYYIRTKGQQTNGEIYRNSIVFQVEWKWISIPVTLIVLIACLLIYTASETRRKSLPVWTDSIIAKLVRGVDDEIRAGLLSLRTTEEMEKACENITVILSKNDHVLKTA